MHTENDREIFQQVLLSKAILKCCGLADRLESEVTELVTVWPPNKNDYSGIASQLRLIIEILEDI